MTPRIRRDLAGFVAVVAVLSGVAIFALRVSDASDPVTTPTKVRAVHTSKPPVIDVPHAFAATSFWYQRLPKVTPINPSSALYVNNIESQIAHHYGNAYISTTSYSAPIYTVSDNQALTRVSLWNCLNKPNFPSGKLTQQAGEQLRRVPLPADAHPAAGTDGALAVWQPSTDTYWETWKTRIVNGHWQACWGGRLDGASKTQGTFPDPFGSTATGISLLGGVIRLDEFRRGYIDHVVNLALPETRSGALSWPATHTDGRTDSEVAIPEGLRFRLDPTLDLSRYDLTPVGRMIAVAAQKYGFVVRDKAGAVSVYGEDPTPVTSGGESNPYNTFFQGKRPYQVLDNFPWDRLIALPMNYGKPASGR